MTDDRVKYLHCHSCGKQVSTGFIPVPTETPDQGLIVRAWIECPECIEQRMKGETIVQQEERGVSGMGDPSSNLLWWRKPE